MKKKNYWNLSVIIQVIAACMALVFVSCSNSEKADPQSQAIGTVVLDEETFPDRNFRKELCQIFPLVEGDTIPDKWISYIEKLGLSNKGIKSLKGIENFDALRILDCSCNQLTELDVSHNKALTFLDCGSNQLTNIDVSEIPLLEEFGFSHNQLNTINVTHNPELRRLFCNDNPLNSIDVSQNPQLTEFRINDCKLKELDVSNNPNLTILHCNGNDFKKLDLSKNTKLTELNYSKPFFRSVKIIRPANNPDINTSFFSLDDYLSIFQIENIRIHVDRH